MSLRRLESRKSNRAVVALVMVTWGAGCSGATDSGDTVGPGPEIPGILEVTVTVEGTRPDANGYAVTLVSADAPGEPVSSAGGTVRFPDVPPGSHSVRLEGLAANCFVEGANPRSVDLHPDQTFTVHFLIRCPGPGKLLITTASLGQDLPDGYTLTLEGPLVREEPIGANDSLLIEAQDGRWNVRLGQVPENCLIEPGVTPETATASLDPLEVRLLSEVIVRVQFTMACLPRFSSIAFQDFPSDIYVVPAIGGRAMNVTNHGLADDWASDGAPALSPDRSRIAFVSNRGRPLDYFDEFFSDLFAVDSEGRGLMRLTNTPGDEWIGPQAWSPDGSRIAFTYSDSTGTDIYVMAADGSGVVRLTDDGLIGCSPAWSPDGGRIAFCAAGGIYRMAPVPGSSMIHVVSEGRDPAWSPEGSRIAYVRYNPAADLAVIGIDGTGLLQMNPYDNDLSYSPSWSPDGSWIAFTRVSGESQDVVMVRFLGDRFGEVVRITSGSSPSWR